MRWLMCVVLLVAAAPAMWGESVAGLPAKPAGYVNDYAGVLSPETVQNLEALCAQVDSKAHAQIAVATIKTIDPDKSGGTPSIEEFATALEEKWKVGAKGTDRGVLMLLVMSPRRGRIEVGYGLEGVLNDAKVGDIGRAMGPYDQRGDYNDGVTLGVRQLAQDIAADAGVTLSQTTGGEQASQAFSDSQPQQQIGLFPVLLFGGIILLVIVVLIRTGHIGLLFFFLFNILGGGGGRGGGGGNDGGGGFGGFGGGSSGGGGASGDF
jgi:uncharacterized protein